MKLFEHLGRPDLAPTKLRQEIFALGGRHQGDALAGARKELTDPDLTPERRSLLRAVIRQLEGKHGLAGVSSPGRPSPAGLRDAAYVAVLIAAATWATMILKSMQS